MTEKLRKATLAYEIAIKKNPTLNKDSFIEGYFERDRELNTPYTLKEYLKERDTKYNSLTAAEANILAIEYPLRHGWVSKYGSMIIMPDTLSELKLARKNRITKVLGNKENNRNIQSEYIKNTRLTKSAKQTINEVQRLVSEMDIDSHHKSNLLKPVKNTDNRKFNTKKRK